MIQWNNNVIYIFYTGNATFKQQDPWVFSCKDQPKRNQHSQNNGSKTKHHHKSCIQLAGSQKETTSARLCSAAAFLKTPQKETPLGRVGSATISMIGIILILSKFGINFILQCYKYASPPHSDSTLQQPTTAPCSGSTHHSNSSALKQYPTAVSVMAPI